MVVTGRLAAVAAVAAVAATAVLPSWWGVLILTGVLALLIGIDVLALGRVDGLELSRLPVTTVRSGRTTAVELTVVNRGTRTLRGVLWDDWPASARATTRTHPLHLPPNTRTRLTTTLRPSFRGDRAAGPVTLRLLGPMGLAGRQFRRAVPARVRALPPFRSEGVLASKVAELHLLEGSTVVNARGQGSEFDSFREYVAGDDVRAIDWRATARAADVLVRTWRPERHRRLLILLDTGRLSAGRIGEGTRLDASIEAALLLGGLAAAAGDAVDLLAYDRTVRTEVRGGSGKGLQPKLMHALAGVVPALVDTDTTGLVRTALMHARRRSLVVWFTSLDGAMVEENLLPVLPVLTRRHRVILVSVTDPDVTAAAARRATLTDIYTAAAAEAQLAERALTRESLRRKGIDVVTTSPERLPVALADEYLELKRSGAM
ncbi:DUF58 domain-containing protein [Nocardia mexicana]|uniref:Uncharacterized protein (DUF58 family) n=1 Tax=Nocardia mexicana TaxID=279262 RepID=A0A370GXF1_9NOCA|nr:DUF58 domain-containing protein [Nocardia mexicana]RDI48355.1 uncharacterized protein (DUF58 family) [Nocardia mexicana]